MTACVDAFAAALLLPRSHTTVNIVLWYYAQQNAPAKKSKRVGAKKVKRETLKQGIRVLGD